MIETLRMHAARRKDAEAGVSLAKLRRWYADGDGQTPPPTQEPPPDKNGGSGGDDDQNPKWLPDRLERERRKLLKDLGVEDPQAVKDALAELKKLKDAQLSDSEKQQAALKEAQDKAAAAEARAQAAELARKKDKLSEFVRGLAVDEKAVTPDDVVDKLLTEASAEKWMEDPKASEKAIRAGIETLRKDRPHWFKSGGQGSPSNRKGVSPPSDAKETLKNKNTWSL